MKEHTSFTNSPQTETLEVSVVEVYTQTQSGDLELFIFNKRERTTIYNTIRKKNVLSSQVHVTTPRERTLDYGKPSPFTLRNRRHYTHEQWQGRRTTTRQSFSGTRTPQWILNLVQSRSRERDPKLKFNSVFEDRERI